MKNFIILVLILFCCFLMSICIKQKFEYQEQRNTLIEFYNSKCDKHKIDYMPL